MSDPEDPDPDEPEAQPARGGAVRLDIPRWLIVFVVVGWMLAVRIEMTTDYVARGRLELLALAVTLLASLASTLRFVLKKHPEETAPPSSKVRAWRFVVILVLGVTQLGPPIYGYLALYNRVGRTDDRVFLRCTATRLESRIRLRGGRGPVVYYACKMPDGQTLRGRAREDLPAEVGKPLVVSAARGRLGVWMRIGKPEPVAEAAAQSF